jgi:hypothetical protein
VKVRNSFGDIVEVPDDPGFKKLLKSLGLTQVLDTVSVPPEPEPEAKVPVNIIPVFESLLNQVPEDLVDAVEIAVFVSDLPGFENFTEADASDFLNYRLEKRE